MRTAPLSGGLIYLSHSGIFMAFPGVFFLPFGEAGQGPFNWEFYQRGEKAKRGGLTL